ncbi:hypothetical protein NDU88_007683 [Pleurodeles waltl]|uniref:Uncharacterized protein n=1 Tax=Pleurodeles waltl TaxID=8319 RepID=A0AAV7VR52_PLEWA|nr:hypothetical protein NDU88_007683 [Pleurodeles waltl]
MCGENRSPISGSRPRHSGEDNLRPKKGRVAGPAAWISDHGSCRNSIRLRREARRNTTNFEVTRQQGKN